MKPSCLLCLLIAGLVLPPNAVAQDELTRRCSTAIPATSDAARRFCNLVAQAIEIGPPRIGIALTAGNPVPGSASTLGMRIGTVPRVNLGARLTAVRMTLPPIESFNSSNDLDAALPALNIDASVGVFSGFALLPTVGGFASLDLVGSLGTVPLPEADGFDSGRLTSWALGARVGILRESFTAPGVSLTGMYRRINDVSFGDGDLAAHDSYFDASGLRVWSLRGVVGKRLLGLGLTAGLGYDNYQSDVSFGVRNPAAATPARFDLSADDFANRRVTAFGSAHWTTLILSLVGEAGWQSGGDDFTAPLPPGRASSVDGAVYASFAAKVAL